MILITSQFFDLLEAWAPSLISIIFVFCLDSPTMNGIWKAYSSIPFLPPLHVTLKLPLSVWVSPDNCALAKENCEQYGVRKGEMLIVLCDRFGAKFWWSICLEYLCSGSSTLIDDVSRPLVHVYFNHWCMCQNWGWLQNIFHKVNQLHLPQDSDH